MRGRRSTDLVIAALVASFALAVPAVASAQTTWNVNTTADGDGSSCDQPPEGDCTLREALYNLSSGDTVIVPAGEYGLDESLGSLLLFQDATVRGAGARETIISGANHSRVLELQVGAASISGVALTGGDGTGGTFADGNGGALYVGPEASLTLTDSTVAGNTARGHGGGIYALGSLTLVRSTVSENQAGGDGGGVFAAGSSLTVEASTVSGNGAGALGGGIYSDTALSIARSTIASNTAPQGGAGIYDELGEVTINDTIVAALGGSTCAGFASVGGSHNMSADVSCPFNAAGDLKNVDANLAPLNNYGGPTNTMALNAGSPAIGAANPVGCAGTDQRGVVRPQQATCDIGAFEYIPPPPQQQQQPPPPPPEEEEQPLPPPVARKAVNALPKSGRVRVKLPGTKRYVQLTGDQQVPVGTIFDTRKGHVTLVAAANRKGSKTATSEFWAGVFKVTQTKGKRPITQLKLTEKLTCGKAGKASTAKKKKGKKRKRRLWGNGRGRFRTRGQFSSATVRGTRWLTQDHCNRTWTVVKRGRVAVRDFVRKKTVIVRAGRGYIARKKQR